jgi:hypothetical protein
MKLNEIEWNRMKLNEKKSDINLFSLTFKCFVNNYEIACSGYLTHKQSWHQSITLNFKILILTVCVMLFHLISSYFMLSKIL